MSKEPEVVEKQSKPHADNELPAKQRLRRSKLGETEATYEPSEDELAVVAHVQYHGAPDTVDYLDQNDASTISAAHQYYVIRFTRLSSELPPPPSTPEDPTPAPYKDRVYEIASVTLRARPGSAIQGMEQQGLILHPTPAEIDEAAGQSKFLSMPRPRPVRADGKHMVDDQAEPPLLPPPHKATAGEHGPAKASK